MAHEKFDGLKFEMDCMPTQRPQISEQNLGLRRNTTFQQLFGALQIIPAATYNAMAQQPPARLKVDKEIDELQFYMELDAPNATNVHQAASAASSQQSKENRLPPSHRSPETQVAVAAHRESQVRGLSNIQPLPAKSAAKAPYLALSTQQNIAPVSQLVTSSTPSPGTVPRVQIGFTPRTSHSPKAQTPTSRSAAQSPAFMVRSPSISRSSNVEPIDPPVHVGRPLEQCSGIQLMESIFSQRAAQPVEAASLSQNPESTQSSPVGSFEEFKFSM